VTILGQRGLMQSERGGRKGGHNEQGLSLLKTELVTAKGRTHKKVRGRLMRSLRKTAWEGLGCDEGRSFEGTAKSERGFGMHCL